MVSHGRDPCLDDYERLEKLGEGTYGVVYKAKHKESGDIVALKKIRLDGEEEGVPSTAIREISTLKELEHPCIVSLLGVIMDESRLHLVFEFLDKDLKKYMDSLEQDELLSPQLVKSYSYQITNAICFCHMRRIFHRDLKPQNLLINQNGVIKLADFGLARTFGIPVRVYTHEVVTLWYRAPEVLLGCRRYGSHIDVWSIGTIICEMLNRQPLFAGDSEIDQIYKIFQKRGTPNETLWPGVSQLQDFRAESCPNWTPQPMISLLKRKDEAAADLLELLLTYDPAKRITAKAALHHRYFHDLDWTQHPIDKLTNYPLNVSSFGPDEGIDASVPRAHQKGQPSSSGTSCAAKPLGTSVQQNN